jgi:hypothetical protein
VVVPRGPLLTGARLGREVSGTEGGANEDSDDGWKMGRKGGKLDWSIERPGQTMPSAPARDRHHSRLVQRTTLPPTFTPVELDPLLPHCMSAVQHELPFQPWMPPPGL